MKLKFLALMVLASFSVAAQASVDNLVVNGDFESGNVGFGSEYSSKGDQTKLPDGDDSQRIWHEGTYIVGADANAANPWFSNKDNASFKTGTKMMMVNGALTTAGTSVSDVSVWNQTVQVVANTEYYFSALVASLDQNSPATLAFSINGQKLVSTDGTGLGSFTATADGAWKSFYAVWNSGSNVSANLNLVNFTSAAHGNDFALDNIAMSTTAPIPEPETYALMGMGLLGLMAARRRKLQATK
jgi:hypothetical protein